MHAQDGEARVVFIPGNHDEAFRDYVGLNFGGDELALEAVHVTADGRRLLVCHGDEFDGVVLYAKWLAFLGDHAALHGAELASAYAAADVFVFPSRTDTFGLVNIEALACGLPVAAYPERGPIDIIGAEGRGMHGGSPRIGALDKDLAVAIRRALSADRVAAAAEARHYGWNRCTDRFLEGLATEAVFEPQERSAA